MKILIPEAYSIPEDTEDGSTFEELVTFRLDGDSVVPTMIGGVEIAMEDEEVEDEVEDSVEDESGGDAMAMRMLGIAEDPEMAG